MKIAVTTQERRQITEEIIFFVLSKFKLIILNTSISFNNNSSKKGYLLSEYSFLGFIIKAYSESSHTSKMELFRETVNDFQSLYIFPITLSLDG